MTSTPILNMESLTFSILLICALNFETSFFNGMIISIVSRHGRKLDVLIYNPFLEIFFIVPE